MSESKNGARKGSIFVGTTVQKFLAEAPPGQKLLVDTDSSVLNLEGHREANVYHLTRNSRYSAPDEIPTSGSTNAGESGAAWDCSHALLTWLQAEERDGKLMEWLREMVVAPSSRVLDVLLSAFGGTGNGIFPRLRDLLARQAGEKRVVFIHYLKIDSEKYSDRPDDS